MSFVSVFSPVSIGLLLRQGTLSAVRLTAFAPFNVIATIQCVTSPLSFVVLGFMFLWDRAAFRTFFRPGDLNAPATRVRWLGRSADGGIHGWLLAKSVQETRGLLSRPSSS